MGGCATTAARAATALPSVCTMTAVSPARSVLISPEGLTSTTDSYQSDLFGGDFPCIQSRRAGAVVGGAIADPVENRLVLKRPHIESHSPAVRHAEGGLEQDEAP